MTRILIVEDDRSLARVLNDSLSVEGFQCRTTGNGNTAITVAASYAPDLVLLDIGLPGKSGFELCRLWREGPRIPIIMLTARGQKQDKLDGLKVGADDYVTKPFDLEELVARVRAVLRRARPSVSQIKLGSILIDFETHRASNGDKLVELSHREFALLRYLAERPNSMVHRDELLQEIWGYPESPDTRSVDHAIARLRRKVESDPHHPQFIHTVYAGGYLLTAGKPDGEPHAKH
ncbi:MAG: response regulator transcription factor [Vicinamibacterales bacterium]